MNAAKRTAIFTRLRDANPHPTTELNYETPFQLLIAVMLSAQSTDVGVNKVTAGLFAAAPTPETMLALGLEGIESWTRSLNYYRAKSKHVLATCGILLREHGGEVPRTREALEKLPGVGRKTANVILNTAFGQPTLAVDTHIFRVANRTGLGKGKDVLEVEQRLLRLIPKEFLLDAHHWLILHGRYVCQARKPRCGECRINDLCEFRGKDAAPDGVKGKKHHV